MYNFTLRQLQILIAVADHLSISDAARSLHLSQPAISQQIRKLEVSCGKPLLEQVGKRIYLTEEGKLLLAHAIKVIEQADVFKSVCYSQDSILHGKLKLAVGLPLQDMFFKAFGEFNASSKVDLELYEGGRNTQLQYICENRADFGLMVHAVRKVQLVSELISNLPMTFILSPQHPLANRKKIMSQMLSKEKLLVCEEDSANYFQIHELLEKMKNPSAQIIQIRDQHAVKRAVMANMGVSVLPIAMLRFELKHKLLIPMKIYDLPHPHTAAYWVQHVNKKLSPLAESFKKFIFNELKGEI